MFRIASKIRDMKRTLLLATLVGAFITAFGQNDTIFYLDFESE